MTPKWLAAAALLAATAVGTTVASGSASTGPATIRITDRQLVDAYFGDGVGSREVVRSTLYERDGGKRAIGSAAMICTYVAARERSCTSTFTLPRGTIVATGVLTTRLLYEFAIVGGTGLYDNARGTLLDTVIQLRPRRNRLRELMKVTLGADYIFVEAPDGETAIALCRDTLPDLVLLDVMLPGSSGLQVLETMRNDEQLRDIPVIVVSAWQTADDRANAATAGADDFLGKPFELEELTDAVTTLLERRT